MKRCRHKWSMYAGGRIDRDIYIAWYRCTKCSRIKYSEENRATGKIKHTYCAPEFRAFEISNEEM